MDTRRIFLLQQMGMTLWESRTAAARSGFQPDSHHMTEHCQILLVAESNPASHGRFVRQVLKTMGLEQAQSHWVKPESLSEISQLPKLIWLLGEQSEAEASLKLQRSGHLLVSADLTELQHNMHAKRDLWHQICTQELQHVD